MQAVARHQAGDLDGAERLYGSLLDAPSQAPDAWHYLGLIALARGDLDSARTRILRAIAALPGRPQFHCNLGNVYKRLGLRDEAEQAYRRAIAAAPDFPEARYNLATLLIDGGDDVAAIALLREAIRLREVFPQAWATLAAALYREEFIDEAAACYERAIALQPGHHDARLGLCGLLVRQGDARRALAEFRQLTQDYPESEAAWCGYLMTMNYLSLDAHEVFSAHCRFGDLLSRRAPSLASPVGTRGAGRLRVGVLSPDLRQHAMRFFVRPILDHADHDRVELFAYYSWHAGDAETARLRQGFDHWRDIARLDDATAIRMLLDDRLDVLVDLAGHTSGGRPGILAARVAPLQVSMLGYMNTTGLATVDVRISDPVAAPPEQEALYVERLERLPASQWCYSPDPGSPAVNELPMLRRGYPTIGLFHTPAKMSDEAFAAWAALMSALPTARLLVILWGNGARRLFSGRAGRAGIPADRIDFRDPLPHGQYLSVYHEVDVSLDVFPYSGGTVSCESLWMGVPFVSYAAPCPQGRGGASLLSAVGLPELIAGSPRQVVEGTLALLENPARLAQLRAGLRQRMRQSPLMDGEKYAADFFALLHRLARPGASA